MKRTAVMLLVAAFMIWWLFTKPEETTPASQVPAPSSEQIIPSSPGASPIPAKIAATSAVRSHVPPPDTNRDDPIAEIVPFEIKGKLAVWGEDMVLGEVDANELKKGQKLGWAEAPRVRIWQPGVVPYAIDTTMPDPGRVERAIEIFRDKTALQFVKFEGQEHALYFENVKEGCRSYLGQQQGVQPVFISQRCGEGAIVHEILHALGFVHEQMRADRDSFIEILWENIENRYHDQFKKVGETYMDASGLADFDYRSIMLYDPHMFAKGNRETLRSRTGDAIAPEKKYFSAGDLERLSRLYGK